MPTTNREVGNAWTAHVLGELFEDWPRRVDFNAMDISVATGVEPKEDAEEFFDDLMGFLRRNGFVHFDQETEGNAYGVELTEKGFGVLGAQPDGLDQPLGTKLKAAAMDTGKEARSAAVASLVGIAVGAAWKTVQGS